MQHKLFGKARFYAIRSFGQADPITRMDERSRMKAMAMPTMISGQGAWNQATAPAAISTPIFDRTSLREHSKVLDMFTSCARNCHKSRREIRLAASVRPPKTTI